MVVIIIIVWTIIEVIKFRFIHDNMVKIILCFKTCKKLKKMIKVGTHDETNNLFYYTQEPISFPIII